MPGHRSGRAWSLRSMSIPRGPLLYVARPGAARHPQTLLATRLNGQPLTVDHGALLRLLVPMKLGLKNVKPLPGLRISRKPEDYLAPTWIFPLRRNLTPLLVKCNQSAGMTIFGIAQQDRHIFCQSRSRLVLGESTQAK